MLPAWFREDGWVCLPPAEAGELGRTIFNLMAHLRYYAEREGKHVQPCIPIETLLVALDAAERAHAAGRDLDPRRWKTVPEYCRLTDRHRQSVWRSIHRGTLTVAPDLHGELRIRVDAAVDAPVDATGDTRQSLA
jgi:hypothetical protein